MKTKWTEHASRLLRANVQVTFSHLAAFVRERAEIASNEWREICLAAALQDVQVVDFSHVLQGFKYRLAIAHVAGKLG